jgi:PAS domain S-box-containing protein
MIRRSRSIHPVAVPGDATTDSRREAREADAEAKLRQAEVEADAKLRQAEVEADATLRRAEVPAAAMLHQAALDAEAMLRRAEAPAEAMLHQAAIDAEATLRRAQTPAETMLRQALLEAEAMLRRAEAPAEAMLHQATLDAQTRLRRAEAPAEAMLHQATVEAQATLQQAEQEQHDVFERFFALSLDMMCISSARGYFTRVNPSFDVLGYSRDELLSRPALELVHPDDRAATEAAYLALAPECPAVKFENRYRCKDGSYRWLSWASSRDTSGAVYSMARDITEAKGHHEILIRAKEAAEHVNHELESFSYSVAHDLRAPLRSINSFTQALLEDYVEKLDVTGMKYLNFIHDASHHMAQLIDGLLGLSRVTRSVMRCQEVDLSDLARAVIARLRASQPTRHVEVLIQDGMLGDGDRLLLAIVLDNLLGNAWKFTAKRSDARIELSATVKDAQRVYLVRDNGAGFDMALASNLFGVFQRLHSDDEFEGTGIGLATVERIIARHGGRIWAEGSVERGATFYFTLYDLAPRE